MQRRTSSGETSPNAVDPMRLSHEIANTKTRIHRLASERSQISLRALQGDVDAIARIKEIDTERGELLAREETMQSALQELRRERQTPVDHEVRKQWSDLQRKLIARVRDRWEIRAPQLARFAQEGRTLEATKRVEDILHHIVPTAARELLEPLVRIKTVEGYRPMDSKDYQRFLRETDAAKIERETRLIALTNELIATTKLPEHPKVLTDALKAFDRMGVQNANMRVFGPTR